MAIKDSQYYFNSTSGEKRCVVLYTEGVTEIWEKDNSGVHSLRVVDGDQFASLKQQTAAQGFQPDSNPGWQAPAKP